MIKLSSPHISKEAMEEVCKVLESGMLVQGEKVLEFENELKNFIKVKYVSAVSSGTAALHLALEALEIGESDAVIVPDFTFVATANVVELQKARTVLVDVDPTTYNMCPEKLEEAIINYNFDEKLKAIIVVHEFGAPANMTKIMEIAKKYNLFVIEDAACSLGAYHNNEHVGTFGDIGCFSFHPRKSITTGEGGAIITNNLNLDNKVKLLRNHGLTREKSGLLDVVVPGFNYRMTEFQAVMGRIQLHNFRDNLFKRRNLVEVYYRRLNNIVCLNLPKKINGHAWQSFMILLSGNIDSKNFVETLRARGIEVGKGAQAIHTTSYYKNKYDYRNQELEVSTVLLDKGIVLPLDSELTLDDINLICNEINDFLEN